MWEEWTSLLLVMLAVVAGSSPQKATWLIKQVMRGVYAHAGVWAACLPWSPQLFSVTKRWCWVLSADLAFLHVVSWISVPSLTQLLFSLPTPVALD